LSSPQEGDGCAGCGPSYEVVINQPPRSSWKLLRPKATPQTPKYGIWGIWLLTILAETGLFLTYLGCSSMACCLMCTFVGKKLRFDLPTDVHYIGTPGM